MSGCTPPATPGDPLVMIGVCEPPAGPGAARYSVVPASVIEVTAGRGVRLTVRWNTSGLA